jgi:hypothetical protein
MKGEKVKSVVFGLIFIFGIVLISTASVFDRGYAQTNSTLNQTTIPNSTQSTTTSAQTEASQSIRGVITETGEFLDNVTQKIVTSKSAETILNETSDVLGEAYIEVKNFFSPN